MTERVQQERLPTRLADLAEVALAGNLAGINSDYIAATFYEAQARIASLEAELEEVKRERDDCGTLAAGRLDLLRAAEAELERLRAVLSAALEVPNNKYSETPQDQPESITYVTPRDPRAVLLETRQLLRSALSPQPHQENR